MPLDELTPPIIKPCLFNGTRPLWSVMIPVYNCSSFLPETLQCVLLQDPGADQMQIEVIDDASIDADVKKMVDEIGKGRVTYYRQSINVGSLRNFETCINRANGQLIHLLHGDDKVRDGYYKKIGALFQSFPKIGAAFCRYAYIDEKGEPIINNDLIHQEDGVLKNWLLLIAERQRTQYCTMTVKRETYEKVGGFYGVNYGEDWEMWARIAFHYPVAYTPDVLAEYRLHAKSISSRSFSDGKYIRDLQWVIQTIQKFIPEGQRRYIKNKSKRYYAHYAISVGNKLWQVTHNKAYALVQIKEALKLHNDPLLWWKAAKLSFKMIINYSGSKFRKP